MILNLGKLKESELYFHSISEKLSSPEAASDQSEFAKLMKEYKRLLPIVEKLSEYELALKSAKEAEELLYGETDPEMRSMISEELKTARASSEALAEELTLLLIPKDPNDEKNVVVEIRACAGGEEAALFAASLFRMYSMFSASHNFNIDIISANETELGGYREISFIIEGEGAYSKFKFESGVHRVQRVPETESQGRVHTSTVSVAVLPEAEDIDIQIIDSDLKIESIKSSGAGGQHINKTESAVRILHKPSGIIVECQEERSQFKNKDKALKLLRSKLFEIKQSEQEGRIAETRKSQVGTGDRSEKIRTYNYPQSRMTDHRIGFSIYSLDSFLDGNIDELINALAADEAAKKLKDAE